MEASGQALSAPRAEQLSWAVWTGPLAGLFAQILLLAGLAATVGLTVGAWFVGLACGVAMDAALAHGLSRHLAKGMGAADWVTLSRTSLAVGAAALVMDTPTPEGLLVAIAVLALALDYADGWVARRTASTAALGAWFDGEADAFLLLVLSVYVAPLIGGWVLAIGGARYAFLAAGWLVPWMRAPLPERYWRKVVAATQGIVLVVAAAQVLPQVVTEMLLAGALMLLAESFGRDVWWLWTRRQVTRDAVAIRTQERSRLRRTIDATFTVLAALIVWAALVAPSQPQDLSPAVFLRVPLEGLVVVALAVVLPTIPRRILAAVLGSALTMLVLLKVTDIVFISLFARPFDLVGDLGDAGFGIATLRAALGHTEANLILYGGVAMVLALLVITTLATFRLTRVAADHRRRSLGIAVGLGAVWLLCSLSGARLASPYPIASTSAAGYVVHEIGTVGADIRDKSVFAQQIKQDPIANTPSRRLLTALRGKDVLLVFVESYGQVSVQGKFFSRAVDGLLSNGTKRLEAAGFHARSAFLTSPTFGGISWFAHSTLQSGAWANSQRRYDQLVTSRRFTLSDAFKRAGWRTINFAPADDLTWPEGSSFYHYDKLYDRRNMGYRGPAFDYAPMPDQYMFAALQRLELSRVHRRALFAEVDTVSSHMPWDRIPQMIPWTRLGDGSIFDRIPAKTEPRTLWWYPHKVKAAYARSLEYSLNVLISFVRRYGKKNLVLIVAGDEQPLPIVSGHGANHDVPVSIIAHDPSVLRRIGSWGWNAGLLPSPAAPVMRMSAFRDRFLTAYGQRRRPGDPTVTESHQG